MKSFLLSSIYLTALAAAVDRFQVSSRATWLSGSAPLGVNWFIGCALLLFCLVLMAALRELLAHGDRGPALRAGFFHAGLGVSSYVVWRTGMATLNPWCTGGRLCASREIETWPLAWTFALGLALLCVSSAFRGADDLEGAVRSRRNSLRDLLKKSSPAS